MRRLTPKSVRQEANSKRRWRLAAMAERVGTIFAVLTCPGAAAQELVGHFLADCRGLWARVREQAVILTTAPAQPSCWPLGRVFGRFVVGLRLRDHEQRVAIMELGQQLIDVGAIERDGP